MTPGTVSKLLRGYLSAVSVSNAALCGGREALSLVARHFLFSGWFSVRVRKFPL
jgi:hypothetical protein